MLHVPYRYKVGPSGKVYCLSLDPRYLTERTCFAVNIQRAIQHSNECELIFNIIFISELRIVIFFVPVFGYGSTKNIFNVRFMAFGSAPSLEQNTHTHTLTKTNFPKKSKNNFFYKKRQHSL